MNRDYTYEKEYLWYNDAWKDKDGQIDPLFQWLGDHAEISVYPACARLDIEPEQSPYYKAKTNALDLPEVINFWKEQGLKYTSLEQGQKHWISMIPTKSSCENRRLKALIILHREDCSDPYWAMDTMEKYRELNELAAKRQDLALIYLVANGPDSDHIFGNIMQEACCLYPIDLEQVYLDVSLPLRLGVRLSDIEGFSWVDKNGDKADPDRLIEDMDGIPVLNISGRWGTKDSLTRGLIMNQAMNRGRFDTERLIRSTGGKKMAEAIELEFKYQTVYDPGYSEYFESKGLKLFINESAGDRWLLFAPKEQLETKAKLPLVLCMQEVYPGNEHLAVTAASYFYEYIEIAAQGKCMLLFFALEDPDSNDRLYDIAREAMDRYPVDRSRVYVTGHSHDGWFARHFAYRHPDMIAALATMGNSVGHPDPAVIGNDILGVSEQEISAMSGIDMPTININGAAEGFSDHGGSMEKKKRWALDWQRRLRASDCPLRSVDEILRAAEHGSYAERKLGIFADRSESFFLDGIEHYVADIKNKDGRYHLRIASSENMPHTVTPCMIDISWSYLRRFSRDIESKSVVEIDDFK